MPQMIDLKAFSGALESGRLMLTPLPDGTSVMLDVDSLQVYSLNETARFIVESIGKGSATADDLAAALTTHFEIDEATARRDLEVLLAALAGVLSAPPANPTLAPR